MEHNIDSRYGSAIGTSIEIVWPRLDGGNVGVLGESGIQRRQEGGEDGERETGSVPDLVAKEAVALHAEDVQVDIPAWEK
jgi:hypothetical protein